LGVGFIAASNGVAPAKALVATTESPPVEISEIVTVSVEPPSESVSVKVELSLLEVVDESVVMMEDRELELEVVDVSVAMLEVEPEVVDVPVAVLGGGRLRGRLGV